MAPKQQNMQLAIVPSRSQPQLARKKNKKSLPRAQTATRGLLPLTSGVVYRSPLPAQSRRARPVDEALRMHIHGILHPFSTDSWNPTHVQSSSIPSRKIRVYSRGSFKTGTDGVGFVITGPCASDNAVVQNGPKFSPGGVAHADFALGTNGTTNSPYTTGSFGVAVNSSRHNVCSVRVRNITKILDRGGSLYSVRAPDEGSLVGVPTASIIQNFDPQGCAIRKDTSGQSWQYVHWFPRDSDQYEFQSSPTPNTIVGQTNMSWAFGFVAFAPAGTVQEYEFEIVDHVEIISSAVSGTYVTQGTTQNEPHSETSRAYSAVAQIRHKAEGADAPPSGALTNFVHSAILAGEKVTDIVARGTDLVNKIVDGAPRVYTTAERVLGMIG